MNSKPLHIYVSGPYSPSPQDRTDEERAETVRTNIERARAAALEIVARGHLPFVPHTMMQGWEDGGLVQRAEAMALSLAWLGRCDALLRLGPSPGADEELAEAERLGLPVFASTGEIPPAGEQSSGDREPTMEKQPPMDKPAVETERAVQQKRAAMAGPSGSLEVLLTEYTECATSYRHTYATIWQAGGILGAAAAAILAFSSSWVQLFAPVPILAWYLALFLPMDAYGQLRRRRLQQLEEIIGRHPEGAPMWHFRRHAGGQQSDQAQDERDSRPPWSVHTALKVIMLLLSLLQVALLVVAALRWLPPLRAALGG
jgi:hypothetical protein